ncbi:uncharacterized protein VTP21DRAFT_2782 [Calcarisporiella thermophila]|uniref:uncharacterized protein n=1 Tax=Calcarisporiella thermophila TaxID=911321 RepID=UPI00374347AD
MAGVLTPFFLSSADSSTAMLRAQIVSDVFTVYPPKLFPGMAESTYLSRHFSEQGFRMRTRKENRYTQSYVPPVGTFQASPSLFPSLTNQSTSYVYSRSPCASVGDSTEDYVSSPRLLSSGNSTESMLEEGGDVQFGLSTPEHSPIPSQPRMTTGASLPSPLSLLPCHRPYLNTQSSPEVTHRCSIPSLTTPELMSSLHPHPTAPLPSRSPVMLPSLKRLNLPSPLLLLTLSAPSSLLTPASPLQNPQVEPVENSEFTKLFSQFASQYKS